MDTIFARRDPPTVPQDDSPKNGGAKTSRRPTLREIHEVVRADGEEELDRSNSALFWSGLAAGTSMSFSLIADGLLRHYLPDTDWAPAVARLGYSLGFLIVILGRQQLFTENTLTVVIPLLHSKDLRTLGNLLRVWSIVLLTNLVGGAAVAWTLANTASFEPSINESFAEIGRQAIKPEFGTVLL